MLKSGKNRNAGEIEECFCCGKKLGEGNGRFRKLEKVFCIDCYKDKVFPGKDSKSCELPERIFFVEMNSSKTGWTAADDSIVQ